MTILNNLRQRLFALLPLLIICATILGLVMFGITNIAKPFQSYQNTAIQVTAVQATLTAQQEQAESSSDLDLLQRRLETSESELAENASVFMTPEQAANILQTLYSYADLSGVEISALQTQDTSRGNQADASSNIKSTRAGNNSGNQPVRTEVPAAYSVQALRLQVSGALPDLMSFITRIREATIPGVNINNLMMKESVEGNLLLMDILIYTSPLASGEAYQNLPQVIVPTAAIFNVTPTVTPPVADTVIVTTPESTSVAATSDSEPALELIYSDSFDTSDLDRWHLGAGWGLMGDPGAQILQVMDSGADVTYTYNTLKDAAVQMRIRLEKGSARLSLRQSAVGRYSVVLQSTGQLALYRGDALVESAVAPVSSIDRWRQLRLSVIGGVIRVSIDGQELIHALDTAELPPGTLSFALIGDGEMNVDDVQIWGLSDGQ
jgi:hypothetical protein